MSQNQATINRIFRGGGIEITSGQLLSAAREALPSTCRHGSVAKRGQGERPEHGRTLENDVRSTWKERNEFPKAKGACSTNSGSMHAGGYRNRMRRVGGARRVNNKPGDICAPLLSKGANGKYPLQTLGGPP